MQLMGRTGQGGVQKRAGTSRDSKYEGVLGRTSGDSGNMGDAGDTGGSGDLRTKSLASSLETPSPIRTDPGLRSAQSKASRTSYRCCDPDSSEV